MRNILLFGLAGLLVASAADARKRNWKELLPHVGVLQSYDAKAQSIAFVGPDGEQMVVRIGKVKAIYRQDQGPIAVEKIADHIGEPVAVVLATVDTARLVSLVHPAPSPIAGRFVKIWENEMVITLETNDRLRFRCKPSVNLAASIKVGEPAQRADWEWFQTHRNQPLQVTLFKFMNLDYIWSITPIDAEPEDSKPNADAETRQ